MDFTKKELQRAFWALLEERPFGKITVKAVVERCGVNRNTFYYHFQDLRDLLHKSVQDRLDELTGPEELVAGLSQHRTAVVHVYRSLPREVFVAELGGWLRRAAGAWADRLYLQTEDRELLLSVCRYALTGFLLEWLEGDMNADMGKNLSRCAKLVEKFSSPPSSLGDSKNSDLWCHRQETADGPR